MKYSALLLFVCAAIAAPVDDESEVQSAQFMNPMMGYPGMNQMMMDPMYGMMGMNQMMNYPGMNSMYPGMNPMYYGSNREDYPVDYSQGCSSSCSCMTVCRVQWWTPCSCRCPPPCPPPPPPPCGGNGCSCNPCQGPVWICPPRCCCCNGNGNCEDPPIQDPEIPEFPHPLPEQEKKEEPRFPLLENLREGLRNRLEGNDGRSEIFLPRNERYPDDIIIRW